MWIRNAQTFVDTPLMQSYKEQDKTVSGDYWVVGWVFPPESRVASRLLYYLRKL